MFKTLQILYWLLFLTALKFLSVQASKGQELPSKSLRVQQNSKSKNLNQICAAQVQNSYLLEAITLQNIQIMNTLEHEIKIRSDLNSFTIIQLQELKAKISSEIEKNRQNADQIRAFTENQAENICTKTQFEEAELHIVSAIENIVHQKFGYHDLKLQEVRQEIVSQNEKVKKEILIYNEKLTDGLKEMKEIRQQVNSENQKTHLKSLTKMFEQYNNRLQSLENKIGDIQDNLRKLRNLPRDCREIQNSGNNVSGIYYIQPEFSSEAFMVLCDMKTMQGGWVYVMNRFDGSESFNLNWTDYQLGFGKMSGEFWIGLEHLYQLTGHKTSELLIELVDWDNKKVHAHYTSFGVGKEEENYPLKTLKGYSGDATDAFSYHLNMKFSTPDHNNSTGGYCSKFFRAGWWYRECFTCHLTGAYLKGNLSTNAKQMGIHWSGFKNYSYSLKQVRMMVRPHSSSSVLLPHEREN